MARERPEQPEARIESGHPFFDLIEQAYRVFRYPKPHSTEVCVGCCMDPGIEADFFNPSIRDLPLRYVQDWYSAACDPNGIAKSTWAYLLPRILEILAARQEPGNVALEISLNRFETGNPAHWSAEEWRVLDAFQRLYLKREFELPPPETGYFLDDVLCMFAIAGWPLEDLLDQVLGMPDAALAQRLWHDWCRFIPGCGSIWITAFWERSGNTRVFEFYTSKNLLGRMEALALADETGPQIARQASDIVSVIERSV